MSVIIDIPTDSSNFIGKQNFASVQVWAKIFIVQYLKEVFFFRQSLLRLNNLNGFVFMDFFLFFLCLWKIESIPRPSVGQIKPIIIFIFLLPHLPTNGYFQANGNVVVQLYVNWETSPLIQILTDKHVKFMKNKIT